MRKLIDSGQAQIAESKSYRATRPWLTRLADLLTRPLVATPVTPNHLTTLSLVLAAGSGLAYASGYPDWMNAGALMFMATRLIDNMDGALARRKGLSSLLGERYDQIVDTLSYVFLFAGIAYGLRHGTSGYWLEILACLAILAGVTNTLVRVRAEARLGRQVKSFPTFAGFQADDGILLIGPATWLGLLQPFFVLVCVGATIFGLWTTYSLGLRLRRG